MNEEEATMPMPEMEVGYLKSSGEEYVPSAGDILISNAVRIEVVDCGAIVKVGCKTIAFSTVEEALEHLIEFNINFYLEKPKQVLTAELKRQQDRGSRNSSQLGRHTARLWYILGKQKIYSFV
jgi:hypothetical protein